MIIWNIIYLGVFSVILILSEVYRTRRYLRRIESLEGRELLLRADIYYMKHGALKIEKNLDTGEVSVRFKNPPKFTD